MRKLTIGLALLLAVTLVAAPVQGESFPDVPEDHWAYEAVEELVAAGVVEGYPDGEYKGQRNMTRYEMAMIIARALDNINAELAMLESDLMYLQDEVDELAAGLTAEQVQDVTAIVEAMIADAMPEVPDELTEAQAEEVQRMLAALREEFQEELDMLGAELGAMEYVIEYIVREEQEAMAETIADLESRIEALESPPFVFRGEYSVNFAHTDLVDGEPVVVTETDYYYVDGWPSQLFIEGDEQNFDSAAEYAEFIRNWIGDPADLDDLEDQVEAFNDEVPAEYELQVAESVTETLPGWTGAEAYPAPVQTTGFTQSLALGFDIYTELFEASIDISIDDDTFDMSDTLLEVEADNWAASFSPANAVSQRDFAIDSATIKGVTFDYHPFGIETLFGEYTEDVDTADDTTKFIWAEPDEDEDEETGDWVFEEIDLTEDFYLLGAGLSQEFAGVELGATYAMKSNQFDFMDEGNFGVFGFDAGTSIGNIDLGADFGYSYPFAEDGEAGMLMRANADIGIEGLADLSGNVRYRDENFDHLLGNAATFVPGTVGFDEFAESIGPDSLGFGIRADQDLFDFLTAGYVEFNWYDDATEFSDWNFLVGGGMPLFFDLEGSASFERIQRGEEDASYDRVLAGLDRDVAPLTLGADVEALMFSEEDEIWTVIGGNAGFEVIDSVSVVGDFELDNNLGFDAANSRTAFGAGLEVDEMEVLFDLLVSAHANYSMFSGEHNGDSLDSTEMSAGAGLGYEVGNLSLSNYFTFTNKQGENVFTRYTDWEAANYSVSTLYDGSKYENVFGFDYEIVENTDFNLDWTETWFIFAADELEFDCHSWQTREITAGVTISF